MGINGYDYCVEVGSNVGTNHWVPSRQRNGNGRKLVGTVAGIYWTREAEMMLRTASHSSSEPEVDTFEILEAAKRECDEG
jgi:hypothetical protein